MKIGPLVRRLAGPIEPLITDLYRRTFFDLKEFGIRVQRRLLTAGRASHILEIGCGEGAMLTTLSPLLPLSRFDGIDLCRSPGRQFQGDRERVRFSQQTAEEFADNHPGSVACILIIDVMHHVPSGFHGDIWRAAAQAAEEEAVLIVKEWLRTPTLIHLLCYLSDRYITGDRIRFRTRQEWLNEFKDELPEWEVIEEWALKPWKNNHAFILKRRRELFL